MITRCLIRLCAPDAAQVIALAIMYAMHDLASAQMCSGLIICLVG